MKYEDLIAGHGRFGSTKRDICLHGLGVAPQDVCENVVIAPYWEPSVLPGLGMARRLSDNVLGINTWDIDCGDTPITYIRTGIGAPVLMDAVLALGVTGCKKIVFVGSAGALNEGIGIGDIVIPEYSVCGDGASRYIAGDVLAEGDIFGAKAYPDAGMYHKTIAAVEHACRDRGVRWHIGRNFSIDTIFAQFAHIDEIVRMGCNVIEMETAAAFRAAGLAGIPTAALFSVSDNTVTNKSLVSGRTKE